MSGQKGIRISSAQFPNFSPYSGKSFQLDKHTHVRAKHQAMSWTMGSIQSTMGSIQSTMGSISINFDDINTGAHVAAEWDTSDTNYWSSDSQDDSNVDHWAEDVKSEALSSEDESEMLVRTDEDDCAAAFVSGRWEQSDLMLQLNSRIIKQEAGYTVLATPTASMQAGPAEHRQEPARDAEKVPAAQKSKTKNKALARCLVMEVKPRIRRRKFGEGSKHSLGGRPLHVVDEGYLTPIAVTPDSLRACFGKPLHEAARTLGICATAVKRICRKMGIKEWPFQRIKPIQKRLAKLQSSTATPDVLREIQELQGQQLALLEGRDLVCFAGCVRS